MRLKITAAIYSEGRSQHFQKGNSLGEFLKVFDQANEVSQIPLSKPKFVIGFRKAKDELFSPCYNDIVENLNRQIRLPLRFDKNKTCVFSIEKFEIYGDQFIFTESVNVGYREIKHLYRNRYFVAYKCLIFRPVMTSEDKVKENNSPTITVTCTKEGENESKYGKRIHFLLAEDLCNIFHFQIIFFNFNLLSTSQIYSTYRQPTENIDVLSLQWRNLVDSGFWSQLGYYCSNWSRWKYNNQLTRNTPSCLAIAVVSKARFLG